MTSVIIGKVTDEKGNAIKDAKVSIIKGTNYYPDIIALTDENGEYDLDNIPSGTFTVAASKEKYQTQEEEIQIGPNDEAQVNFCLRFK